ncbi:unnamed protein product [Allacma fusca]|uniref:polynucleotide adenylyltransferase n=1 Tax=Allacma fusca TaxID=39272 RepID=A0A8J2PIX5_9HEXA|nr:unnamed protein product [Allacma fusca]
MSTPVMESFLKSNNCFEPLDDCLHRKRILQDFEAIFNAWVRSQLGKPSNGDGPVITGMFLTLGSYELGIHGPGADVDILLLVPSQISRQDFFSDFYNLIKSKHEHQISCLRKIEKTYVPVMKFRFLGIDLDIALACFNGQVLPTTQQLLDDICLKGMDIHSVRSLNGFRDCLNIQQLIQPHTEIFRLVLRSIKLWSNRRAIYNNSVGYFSGMALTVLLAKVITEIPDVNISSWLLLQTFFAKYATWMWPNPVKLNHLEANNADAPVLQVWNPHEYSFDKADRMPILTPSYPQRNSAHTATISTRRVMVQEFKRANEIINFHGIKEEAWKEIFAPQDFFFRADFSCYIVLSAKSDLEATDTLSHWDWCAIVRSQIRRMLRDIELLDPIRTVHVCPNSYPHPDSRVKSEFHSLWFVGVAFIETCVKEDAETWLGPQVDTFSENVIRYAEDHEVILIGRTVSGRVVSATDVKTHLHPEISHGVKGWTSLKERKKGHFYI